MDERHTLCPVCKRGVTDLPEHADTAHGLVRLSDGFWYGIDTPDPTKGYHTCQRCFRVTEHVSEATGDYVCPCDTLDNDDAAKMIDQIRAWVRTVDAGLITACEGIEEIVRII